MGCTAWLHGALLMISVACRRPLGHYDDISEETGQVDNPKAVLIPRDHQTEVTPVVTVE